MKKEVLQKYAQLVAVSGVNIQKGQDVIVTGQVDQYEFIQLVVEACYKAGARSVIVDWADQKITKMTYNYQNLETLSYIPEYAISKLKYRAETLPARIYIESEDPDGLAGIDQEKVSKTRQAQWPKIKPIVDSMENKYQWTIVAVPSPAWARKVFPGLSDEEAMEKLWDAILYTTRVTDDPIAEWKKHNADLSSRSKYLNSLGLKELRYSASNGTKLKVGLMDEGLFVAGGETTLGSNIFYNPNMPTEECFTTPKRGEAEGIVYSSKPLSYNGQIIENFSVRFEGGKAVEVHAEKGEDLLKKMISMDEWSAYLGECAFVPYDSPISNSNILFCNTLFDENASCHLALGMGFTNCIKDYEKYSKDEMNKMGVNDSMIHVDFMIGTKDLSIVGVCKDGKEVQIFKDGNWAF